jgi:hypothetical protein
MSTAATAALDDGNNDKEIDRMRQEKRGSLFVNDDDDDQGANVDDDDDDFMMRIVHNSCRGVFPDGDSSCHMPPQCSGMLFSDQLDVLTVRMHTYIDDFDSFAQPTEPRTKLDREVLREQNGLLIFIFCY